MSDKSALGDARFYKEDREAVKIECMYQWARKRHVRVTRAK